MGFFSASKKMLSTVVRTAATAALLGFAGSGVDARAEVMHVCPYDVWCAVVEGYGPTDTTPLSARPAVRWVPQPANQVLISYFETYPRDTGIAVMCTRSPAAADPVVTQLEYTWRPLLNQTYFDVSNVAGDPFVDRGFLMTVSDPKMASSGDTGETCSGAQCVAGDADCNQVYDKDNDDFQGMRTCSDAVVIRLTLCTN
jgi:hypothetical protein